MFQRLLLAAAGTLPSRQKARMTGLRQQGLEKCNGENDAEADTDSQAALEIFGT